jgi:hypothetical protein
MWNVTNLNAFILAKEYKYEKNGTSFLDRYTNTIRPSQCCGIESILDPTIAHRDNTSAIDRKYFQNLTYDCSDETKRLYHVNDTDPDLKLDIESTILYNVTGPSVQIC